MGKFIAILGTVFNLACVGILLWQHKEDQALAWLVAAGWSFATVMSEFEVW